MDYTPDPVVMPKPVLPPMVGGVQLPAVDPLQARATVDNSRLVAGPFNWMGIPAGVPFVDIELKLRSHTRPFDERREVLFQCQPAHAAMPCKEMSLVSQAGRLDLWLFGRNVLTHQWVHGYGSEGPRTMTIRLTPRAGPYDGPGRADLLIDGAFTGALCAEIPLEMAMVQALSPAVLFNGYRASGVRLAYPMPATEPARALPDYVPVRYVSSRGD